MPRSFATTAPGTGRTQEPLNAVPEFAFVYYGILRAGGVVLVVDHDLDADGVASRLHIRRFWLGRVRNRIGSGRSRRKGLQDPCDLRRRRNLFGSRRFRSERARHGWPAILQSAAAVACCQKVMQQGHRGCRALIDSF